MIRFIKSLSHNKAAMSEGINFITSTLMGKQQHKKLSQLVQGLFDSSDSVDFRTPVDWKAFGLMDYPMIIKKPMDLGTVKKNLNNNFYQTVEDCLRDIDLIWQNCKTYNKQNQFFLRLAQKLDKNTKKMIKNYLSFVVFQSIAQKKKVTTAQAAVKKQITKKPQSKTSQPEQLKTYEDRKQNQIEQEAKQEDSPFTKLRKEFLMIVPLCTSEQVGVIFMLINKNESEAIQYDDEGNVKILTQKMSDQLVKRLSDQMDMWGIGYVPSNKRK